jgi:hypothetical protein
MLRCRTSRRNGAGKPVHLEIGRSTHLIQNVQPIELRSDSQAPDALSSIVISAVLRAGNSARQHQTGLLPVRRPLGKRVGLSV